MEVYREDLYEEGQVDFRGKAKVFRSTYGILASILPYIHVEWERAGRYPA